MTVHQMLSTLAGCMLMAVAVQAETLEVGPGKPYAAPSAAIAAAKDGDTIEIAAGTYRNDYAAIRSSRLRLVGVGGKAVLTSEGMIPNGKAIWVVQGDDIHIENVEFRGARVRDRNGAGIRQEGRNPAICPPDEAPAPASRGPNRRRRV